MLVLFCVLELVGFLFEIKYYKFFFKKNENFMDVWTDFVIMGDGFGFRYVIGIYNFRF